MLKFDVVKIIDFDSVNEVWKGILSIKPKSNIDIEQYLSILDNFCSDFTFFYIL